MPRERARQTRYRGSGRCGVFTNETVFSLTERPGDLPSSGRPLGRLAKPSAAWVRGYHFSEGRSPAGREEGRRQDFAGNIPARGIGPSEHRAAQSHPTGAASAVTYERNGRIETSRSRDTVGAGRPPNLEGLDLDGPARDDLQKGVRWTNTSGPPIPASLPPEMFVLPIQVYAHGRRHGAHRAQERPFSRAVKAELPHHSWVTYTDPNRSVGDSAMMPRKMGLPSIPRETPSRGRQGVVRGTEGFVKIHVKRGTDRIVGATIDARQRGEMISEGSCIARASG